MAIDFGGHHFKHWTHFIDKAVEALGLQWLPEAAVTVVTLAAMAPGERGHHHGACQPVRLCPAGICSVWGSSHYSTFDGTSYTFGGNCTYVLMRQIHARLGNLSLYLDNHYCAASATAASCSRALSIHYKSMDIVLTVTTVHGKEEDLVSPGCGRHSVGPVPTTPGQADCRLDDPGAAVMALYPRQLPGGREGLWGCLRLRTLCGLNAVDWRPQALREDLGFGVRDIQGGLCTSRQSPKGKPHFPSPPGTASQLRVPPDSPRSCLTKFR